MLRVHTERERERDGMRHVGLSPLEEHASQQSVDCYFLKDMFVYKYLANECQCINLIYYVYYISDCPYCTYMLQR